MGVCIYLEPAFQFRMRFDAYRCPIYAFRPLSVAVIIQKYYDIYIYTIPFFGWTLNERRKRGILCRVATRFVTGCKFLTFSTGTPTRHRGARSNREFGREIRGQGVQSAARGTARAGTEGGREAGTTGTTGTVAGFEDCEVFGTQVAFAVS